MQESDADHAPRCFLAVYPDRSPLFPPEAMKDLSCMSLGIDNEVDLPAAWSVGSSVPNSVALPYNGVLAHRRREC